MTNTSTHQPVTSREAGAFTLGLMALGVVELGRRDVWFAFREVSSSTARPFTGLELAETDSLPTMLLIGLGVASAVFALGLGMNRASVRKVAGAVLAITGGSLAVATTRAANSLPDHEVVADGWQTGPLMAIAGSVVALIAGFVVAMGRTSSKQTVATVGAMAIASLVVGVVAPVSTPSAEPSVVDNFAFYTNGEQGPRSGAVAASSNGLGPKLVVVNGEPVTVTFNFWEIEDGRIYRTYEVLDGAGSEFFTHTTAYFDDRIYVGFGDGDFPDQTASVRVLSAQDYSTIGTVQLGPGAFRGVSAEGTVVMAVFNDDLPSTLHTVANFDAVLADESVEVALSEPLAGVGGSVDAVGEHDGVLAFMVEGLGSLDVWRDGMNWTMYNRNGSEGQPCAGLELPAGTDEFSRIGAFDANGRALMSFERYDEPTDARVTDLYVADLDDGSVRVITIPVRDVRDIAAGDNQLFVSGLQLVEILDYEATLAAAPVLDQTLATCELSD